MTWNVAVPAGTDNIRDGDNAIRELKTDLATALTAYGRFPISAGAPKFHYIGQKDTTANRPTNGEGGFYFDTTLNQLLRDNGSSWDVMSGEFPKTTAISFFQAAAPTGWTKQVVQNDKFLRVTSGSGGGSGGSWELAAEAAHTHTHNHSHSLTPGTAWAQIADNALLFLNRITVGSYSYNWVTGGTGGGSASSSTTLASGVDGDTDSGGGDTGAGSSHTHTHGSTQHAYIDMIICTKD